MKKTRFLLTAFSLSLTAGLGATSPGPVFTAVDRAIVAVFVFSLAFALVTTLALIPSPRDPRRDRRRGDEPQREALEQGAAVGQRDVVTAILARDLGDPRRR